jgi:hypothetical protein
MKLGFDGLKLMSLNWTSSECASQAPPLQFAVSEVKSSPAGTSLGEKLVPLVILIDQPPMEPVTVSVPAVLFMSPESDPHPGPEQVPLSEIVAITPLTVNMSLSVVVAKVVPKPMVKRETSTNTFI